MHWYEHYWDSQHKVHSQSMTKQQSRCYASKNCGNCRWIFLQNCICKHQFDQEMNKIFTVNSEETYFIFSAYKDSSKSESSITVTSLPAYLKKNEDRMPCAALLHMRNIVAFEWPWRMSKLLGPATWKIPCRTLILYNMYLQKTQRAGCTCTNIKGCHMMQQI